MVRALTVLFDDCAGEEVKKDEEEEKVADWEIAG